VEAPPAAETEASAPADSAPAFVAPVEADVPAADEGEAREQPDLDGPPATRDEPVDAYVEEEQAATETETPSTNAAETEPEATEAMTPPDDQAVASDAAEVGPVATNE
jgi:hypothetical protein